MEELGSRNTLILNLCLHEECCCKRQMLVPEGSSSERTTPRGGRRMFAESRALHFCIPAQEMNRTE